jgi:hypothetical protein
MSERKSDTKDDFIRQTDLQGIREENILNPLQNYFC